MLRNKLEVRVVPRVELDQRAREARLRLERVERLFAPHPAVTYSWPRWFICSLNVKIVRTTPNGIFEPILKGKGNDMAAGTIPLIATTPGIKLLGPLPGDFQSSLTYTAVLMTNAPQHTTAESFIKFLVSAKAKETFAANGAE